MTFIMLSYPTLPKSAKRCFAQQLERWVLDQEGIDIRAPIFWATPGHGIISNHSIYFLASRSHRLLNPKHSKLIYSVSGRRMDMPFRTLYSYREKWWGRNRWFSSCEQWNKEYWVLFHGLVHASSVMTPTMTSPHATYISAISFYSCKHKTARPSSKSLPQDTTIQVLTEFDQKEPQSQRGWRSCLPSLTFLQH